MLLVWRRRKRNRGELFSNPELMFALIEMQLVMEAVTEV